MKALDGFAPYAHWLLRVPFAATFLFHGLGKFPNLAGTAEMMGMPVALLALVALVETLGGLLVLLGGFGKDILTRLGGLVVVPVMLGAIAMVHWPRWSFTPSETHPIGGMEFQVLLIALGLFFAIVGNRAFAPRS